jgi:hypothetical protein
MARRLVRRYPLASYFAVVYGGSLVALAVIGPPSLNPTSTPPAAALVLFPVMVLTVGLAGIGCSAATGGRAAVTGLLRSARRWRVPPGYYAAPLIPPAAILATLLLLRSFLSPPTRPTCSPSGCCSAWSPGCSKSPDGAGSPIPGCGRDWARWRVRSSSGCCGACGTFRWSTRSAPPAPTAMAGRPSSLPSSWC